jgi:hypothetical protein
MCALKGSAFVSSAGMVLAPSVTEVAARHGATEPPRREVTSPQAMAPCAACAPSGRDTLMRLSNLTVPIMPTLRPKLRKVARRSFSMVMALDNQPDAHCCPDYACGSPLCATVIS